MTDDEIPLDITGHERREPPDGTTTFGAESETETTEAVTVEADETDPGNQADERDEAIERNGEVEQGQADEQEEEDEQGQTDKQEEEVEPVELLVQLAEDGEIDPWDIDIVAVTDKFLDRLDEADLRTSGRALFYASVLLRMKSDAMLEPDDPEPEPEPWEQAMAGEDPIEEPDPFATLEQEMDRRLERKRARGSPQTLDELVRDLREAERDNWWKESREYDTSGSPDTQPRETQELDYRSADEFRMDDEPTEADVTGNTHGEDIDEIIDDVYAAVREQYDKGRNEVLFREVSVAGGSRVNTFLGLLFLSHRGQVRLQQDELFGDLWIQDPNAGTGSGEVAAD